MPKGVYDRTHLRGRMRHHSFTGRGPWEAPEEPVVVEFNRGELRLAAEVARSRMLGKPVQQDAQLRAFAFLARLADDV